MARCDLLRSNLCLGMMTRERVIRSDPKYRSEPEAGKDLPVAATDVGQAKRGDSHPRCAVNPGNRDLLDTISEHNRLETSFGIDREPALTQPKILHHFTAHDLQIVCYIANSPAEQENGAGMKRPVREDLQEWIIQKDTVAGKAASNYNIVAFGRRVEQITELG